MSEWGEVAHRSHLQLHQLEYLTFHWDGTEEQALEIVRELYRELTRRDGTITQANYTRSEQSGTNLILEIQRTSDGRRYRQVLQRDDWMVLHLHEGNLYDVEQLDPRVGAKRFDRVRPVVMLRPPLPRG